MWRESAEQPDNQLRPIYKSPRAGGANNGASDYPRAGSAQQEYCASCRAIRYLGLKSSLKCISFLSQAFILPLSWFGGPNQIKRLFGAELLINFKSYSSNEQVWIGCHMSRDLLTVVSVVEVTENREYFDDSVQNKAAFSYRLQQLWNENNAFQKYKKGVLFENKVLKIHLLLFCFKDNQLV